MVTAVSLPAFFDVTDEGLHLYLLSTDPHPPFGSAYHALYHPFGVLVSHSLLGYRLLNIGMMLVAGLYFSRRAARFVGRPWEWKECLPWVFIAVVCSLQPTLTPSYHHLARLASLFWSISVLLHLDGTIPPRLSSLLLAFSVVCGGMARPQFGLVLAVASLALPLYPEFRKSIRWGVILGSWGLGLVLFHGPAGNYIEHLFFVRPLLQASTHQSLLRTAVGGIWWLSRLYAPYLILLAVHGGYAHYRQKRGWRESFSQDGFPLLVILALACHTAFHVAHGTGGWAVLVPLALLVVSRLLLGLPEVRRPEPILAGLAMFVSIAHSLGSNGYFVSYMLLNPVFAITLGFIVRPASSRRLRDLAPTCAYLGLLCILLLRSQVFSHQRSGNLAEQSHPGSGIPFLGGVRIREDVGATMRNLLAALRAEDAVGSGSIVAYPDIPGYVAVSGLTAFGSAWYFTRYPNVDALNCGHLALGAGAGEERVYLLKAADFSPTFKRCFESRLRPDERRFFTRGLGRFWDYRSASSRNLELSGPYLRRQKDR